MKRTMWAVLVVFLGLALPAWGANVSMPEMGATVGETVEVPVLIDNAMGIAGFQLMITLMSRCCRHQVRSQETSQEVGW
jgi:hypothetical protein